MVALDIEYGRWVLVQKILALNKSRSSKDEREYINIIGRWVLSMANSQPKPSSSTKKTGSSGGDVIFRKTTISNKINKKMLSELKEKGLFKTDEQRTAVVKEILSLVNAFLKEIKDRGLDKGTESDTDKISSDLKKVVVIVRKEGSTKKNIIDQHSVDRKELYKYKKFTGSIMDHRLAILTKRLQVGGKDILKKKRDLLILLLLLRYSALVSDGQQWAIPLAMYRNLYFKFNGKVEGFASPINSQILAITTDITGKGFRGGIKVQDTFFGSLFPDTDSPFGSRGSFFNLTLKKIPKDATVITNPPFVPDVMEKTWGHTQKLIQKAVREKRYLRVIGIMPYWGDFGPIVEIPKYKYTSHFEILKGREHFYEDLALDRKRVTSNFPSFVFVVETEDRGTDYSQLTKSMRITEGNLKLKRHKDGNKKKREGNRKKGKTDRK